MATTTKLIYLAGSLAQHGDEQALREWRKKAAEFLPTLGDFKATVPWSLRDGYSGPASFKTLPEDELRLIAYEAIAWDLTRVTEASGILAELHPGKLSEGTSGELTLARYLNIPIVIYAPLGPPEFYRWPVPMAAGVYSDLEEACREMVKLAALAEMF